MFYTTCNVPVTEYLENEEEEEETMSDTKPK